LTPRGARVPEARVEVRVGSSTNGLEPVSAAQRRIGATWAQWVALGAIGLAAIGADQLTKELVTRRLGLGEEADVIGPLSIHHVQNTGIAFGLFPSATALVTAFTALAVAWMLYFFARSGSRHSLLPVALGFLIGGSTSNLLDRLRLGHVTDFLDVRYWPAFNLADSFIVAGVLILLAAVLGSGRTPARERQLAPARRSREDAQAARS
jgi:signal peptidase II